MPITDSYRPYADGRLVGLGLMQKKTSTQVPVEEIQAEIAENAPQLLDIIDDSNLLNTKWRVHQPRALQPSTWTETSTQWQSATPLLGFPDARIVVLEIRNYMRETYGVDIHIEYCLNAPPHPWHARWSTSDLSEGNGTWWLSFATSKEISGPLILGERQDLGFGVFAPTRLVTT